MKTCLNVERLLYINMKNPWVPLMLQICLLLWVFCSTKRNMYHSSNSHVYMPGLPSRSAPTMIKQETTSSDEHQEARSEAQALSYGFIEDISQEFSTDLTIISRGFNRLAFRHHTTSRRRKAFSNLKGSFAICPRLLFQGVWANNKKEHPRHSFI